VKPASIHFSDLAVTDIVEQAEWYEQQSGVPLAKRWEKAVTAAVLRISRYPNSGKPCRFSAVDLQGTRRVPVRGFQNT
jgi:plasmid stabilization system protein ParE